MLRLSRDRARSLDGYKMQGPFVNDQILRQVSSHPRGEVAKPIMNEKRTRRLRKKRKKKRRVKKAKKRRKKKRSVNEENLNGGELSEEVNEADSVGESESGSSDDRSGRDLVYERMKMRTGNVNDKVGAKKSRNKSISS